MKKKSWTSEVVSNGVVDAAVDGGCLDDCLQIAWIYRRYVVADPMKMRSQNALFVVSQHRSS